MLRPWPAMACALALILPAGSAGTADAPEVTDPAGDVAAFGAAVPVALDWADLRAAWFEHGNGSVTLHIHVGGEAPQQGEVGLTFQVGDSHWIAGYTVVPGLYSGGFLSRSDAEGDVPDDVNPEGMPGTWVGGIITTTFPIQTVDPDGLLDGLAAPWGWSESQASNGETYRLDRTEVGTDFLWRNPQPPPPPPEPSTQTKSAPMPLALTALLAAMAAWPRKVSSHEFQSGVMFATRTALPPALSGALRPHGSRQATLPSPSGLPGRAAVPGLCAGPRCAVPPRAPRRVRARAAFLSIALPALLLVASGPATACSELPDPPVHDVFVVVTEEGRTLLRLATGNTHVQRGCSSHGLGHPMFDGRFLGWHAPSGLQVVDLQGAPELTLYRDNSRLHGSMLLKPPLWPGSRLEATDLAPPRDIHVDAPAGWGFHNPRTSVAIATPVDAAGDASTWDFTQFQVYDLVSGAWLAGPVRTDGPAWPGTANATRIPWLATQDWVLFRLDGPQVREWWVYRIATATLHGPYKSPDVPGYGRADAEAIVGDRLYLSANRGTNYGGTATESWSVRLPDGEVGPGQGRPQAGNRTAFFELQERPRSTTSPSPTVGTTTTATTATTAATTPATTGAGTTDQASPAAGPMVLAALAVLAARRRA